MAGRATPITWEEASLADLFHGAIVCILDTHTLDIITRTRCWLSIFSAADTTLLLIGALVGGF